MWRLWGGVAVAALVVAAACADGDMPARLWIASAASGEFPQPWVLERVAALK